MPPKTRDRPRVKGSWRDKGKGECYTHPHGVVCNDPPRGSSGQKGVYKTKTQKKQKADEEKKEKKKEIEKLVRSIQGAEKQLDHQKDIITKAKVRAIKNENAGKKLSKPQQKIRDKPVNQATAVVKRKKILDKLKDQLKEVKKK